MHEDSNESDMRSNQTAPEVQQLRLWQGCSMVVSPIADRFPIGIPILTHPAEIVHSLHAWRLPRALHAHGVSKMGTHQVQLREGGEWRKRRQRGSCQLRWHSQLPQVGQFGQVGVQICLRGLHTAVGAQSDARADSPG